MGTCTGSIEVNESISYHDNEGNIVRFPSPKIEVECGTDVTPEPCPEPREIAINGCEDSVEFDAGDLFMESLGRILQLDVRLRNVCPNRRVALAIVLTEVDEHGLEHSRGMKTMTVPAHHRATCQDVTVHCVKFVLPEDLDVSGTTGGICNTRNFKARLVTHYIDNDFSRCDALLQR